MGRHRSIRLLGLVLVVAFAVAMVGCNATVGVGISVPIGGPYYGPYGPYGPWGGGIYIGGPVWP